MCARSFAETVFRRCWSAGSRRQIPMLATSTVPCTQTPVYRTWVATARYPRSRLGGPPEVLRVLQVELRGPTTRGTTPRPAVAPAQRVSPESVSVDGFPELFPAPTDASMSAGMPSAPDAVHPPRYTRPAVFPKVVIGMAVPFPQHPVAITGGRPPWHSWGNFGALMAGVDHIGVRNARR